MGNAGSCEEASPWSIECLGIFGGVAGVEGKHVIWEVRFGGRHRV